jgi:Tol biopolymer transport system component
MYKRLLYIGLSLFFIQLSLFAQFGENKVQYKNYTWYYIQTDHFDIYFTSKGAKLAEYASKAAEKSLKEIEKSFNYNINNRITMIIYNSVNDFQETNVSDEYLSEGIEGFTEVFKNRVVVQFSGSYPEFNHLIHHELTHAVMNDFYYGGSFQNMITNNINLNLPQWFNEGMAEYQSLGWDLNSDMFMRDAVVNEYLPDLNELSGYIAYRGGESLFHFISQKYGKEKIGEIINKIKGTGSMAEGFKASIGLSMKELNEKWKEALKKEYWPDIAIRKTPDDFAKRLTDPDEGGGFYNTSPAISPQGDKIAFISNRDYYFDVYIMDAIDGKIIKKLVKGNRSADFEELNVITPGLSWSPDESKIALSAKSDGSDVVYIIDVDSEDKQELPIKLEGIQSLSWSPDGKYLAFIGHTAVESDLYIYNFETKAITNLTNDIFTDDDPTWTPDSKYIFFDSDRGKYLSSAAVPDTFHVYYYKNTHRDIYSIDINTRQIKRYTDMENSNETSPVISPDGKEMLFISDRSGINNIYEKNIVLNPLDSLSSLDQIESKPVTNSLNGLYQLSLSKDGKKLVFSTLYKGSYNLFLMTNPFETKLDTNKLTPTVYMASLRKQETEKKEIASANETQKDTAGSKELVTSKENNTSHVYGDSVLVDFNNYVFGNKNSIANADTINLKNPKFNLTDNLDDNGNYKVNRYQITFSPDIIYADAGYSSLYGLLGTTVLSFSDVLGNYRIIGETSLQIDLKNSDYGLGYYDLGNRLNYGMQGFHTARFVYLNRYGNIDLFRFTNYGGTFSLSYPLNTFYRLEGELSWLNVTMENLDDPTDAYQKASYIVPTVGFVHDNTLWGYTAPIDGTRYRFDVLGNPLSKSLSFYSILGDYRTYFKFWDDYSFAFRLSGGYSGGDNPQRFFLGGTDNWINRDFATTSIPLNSPSDFAFLTAALPLRGYDYAQEIGSKYGLLNMELRFPLIKYLVTGALPILFSNIMGVAFVDAGTAWNSNSQLQLFTKNQNGNLVSNDLLTGVGVGARVYLLYFLVKFDIGWAYNYNNFSAPKFYISLGEDF